MTISEIRNSIKNIITDLFPFLGSKSSLFYKAKILAVNSKAGTPAIDGTGDRFYSVDLQFLTLTGEVDANKEILKDVPLDVLFIGNSRGLLMLPEKDSIVRVGFYEGNLAYPYIDGVLSDGKTLPLVNTGDFQLQLDDNSYLRFKQNGNLEIKCNEATVTGTKVSITSNDIILANGTVGVARLNDTVNVVLNVTYGGFGAVTSVSVISATINSASSKVKSG